MALYLRDLGYGNCMEHDAVSTIEPLLDTFWIPFVTEKLLFWVPRYWDMAVRSTN